jgi:hypothetical protein
MLLAMFDGWASQCVVVAIAEAARSDGVIR